jgi:hypothetical protein
MAKKIGLEKIINKIAKEALVSIAEDYDLPIGGSKEEIIGRLISEISPQELLSVCFGVDELREILEEQGLPKSGNKDELVNRVLSFIDTSKVKAKPEKRTVREKVVKPEKSSVEKDVNKIKEIIDNIEFQGTGKTKETDYEKQLVVALQFALGKERVTYEKAVGRSRLDIVVDSANNKQIGIELKLYTGTTSIDRLFGQIDRYIGSIYDKVIAVIVTKKAIATARDEAKRIKKLKNVDVKVKSG